MSKIRSPYQSHFARTAKQDRHVDGVLSTCEGKVGPKHLVRAFNLPLAGTCCKQTDEEMLASPSCRAHCYVHDLTTGRRKHVPHRAAKNLPISERGDFAELMVGAILRSKVPNLKLHVSGDFYSITYIEKWMRIVTICCDVRFLCYTRAWRRADYLPALESLAARPNMNLCFSFDAMMPLPPPIRNTQPVYLMAHDKDHPPKKCLVAFRDNGERGSVPMRIAGTTPVCSHQNGQPLSAANLDCVRCGICFHKAMSSGDLVASGVQGT